MTSRGLPLTPADVPPPHAQSGVATGGEAAQAIYSQDVGHSNIHKGKFEISSIYPRAYRGVAGASSRNLFKNSPEVRVGPPGLPVPSL